LVGFADDYSRYEVGLELYRTQTVDQVFEIYRREVREYGIPKEARQASFLMRVSFNFTDASYLLSIFCFQTLENVSI
jgi:hypothetical protein